MSLNFFTKKDQSYTSFKEGVVLLVDKPKTWSSFSVVNKLRYRFSRIESVKRIKIGHAGTLDPLATGLLIICVGKYTKKIDEFQGLPKRYSGSIFLGGTSPTYDAEVPVDEVFPTEHITDDKIYEEAGKFVGLIQQKPPIFSALSSGGERLYKKARRGEVFEVKSREVHVEKFEITKIEMPEIEFVLDCSKGTYVRSLAYDLGKSLDSGAYLSRLQRDRIGSYDLKDAWNLEELVEVLENIDVKMEDNVG